MESLNGWSILLIIMLIPVLALSGQTKEKDKHGFFGSILLGCGFASIGTRISLSNQKREKSFADLVPDPLA